MGSVGAAPRLERTGSVVAVHGFSCSAACGIFPDWALNPCLLHWQADSVPTNQRTQLKCLNQTYLLSFLYSLLPSFSSMYRMAGLEQDTRTMASQFESSASSPTIMPWWENRVCSHHPAQIKESLNAHHSFAGQHLRGNHQKSTYKYRKKALCLPCDSTGLSLKHSQSKPGGHDRKIISNDLPNDFSTYIGFKFGSRDGQNSGQPALLGLARHWGWWAIWGWIENFLLFFTSQDRYWNFNFSFHNLLMFWKFFSSSQKISFLILPFHGMSFGSSYSAPVVFRLHISTSNLPQHASIFCRKYCP